MRNRLCGSSEQASDFGQMQAVENRSASTLMGTRRDHQVCLFGPERYEARYEYPLVVWLHSCGSSEFELEVVMPELSLQNYVACAPRGTSACDPDGKMFRWSQTPAACAIAEEIVFEAIESAAEQFTVDRTKVFLAGFGSGGTMAWRIAMRYPQRFAGMVSICGDFPHRHQPLLNLADARRLPMLWMFGSDSEQCGVQQVCDTLPVLHAGGLAVDIRQYPCGTELLSNMLGDLNHWMMERVTHQPADVPVAVDVPDFSRN